MCYIDLHTVQMISDQMSFLDPSSSELIKSEVGRNPIKFDLTNENFYITYKLSSGVGSCPTNLPSPARWFKDEAIKATKGN